MKILLLSILISINFVFAEGDSKEEKIYTAKEFQEKVAKEVSERLKKVQVANLSKYSQDLLNKESELIRKEQELKRREEQLGLNEQTFAQSVKKFETKQQNFLGCIDANEKKVSQRVTRMVNVIAGMKPLKAAEILSVQDSELSVKILGRIPPERASKIFNLMDKEISARLQKQYLLMKQ